MNVELSTELSEIIARAFAFGAETSIDQLAGALGYTEAGTLLAATKVVQFVERLHLELVPGPEELEFDSVRVLRTASASGTSVGQIAGLVAAGEGSSIEFKSSMLCSLKDWATKRQLIEHQSLPGEVLKTICAFLNSDGGELLVGVDDTGESCGGVSLDLQLKGWNLDKWQLHFQALVKDRFYEGDQIQPYLRCIMADFESHPVFHVSVMPRTERSFVKREKGKPFEFFVRNGPRTDSLDLPSFYGHLRRSEQQARP